MHDAVVHFVEEELGAGRLPVGGRLPAERALASQLGVSRTSVREGIRILEAMGIVRTNVGSGPDAGAIITSDTGTGITVALRLHLASRTLPVDDIVSTRALLESWAAREAARRADRCLLDIAAALVREMDDRTLSAEQFHALDSEFHVALARAAGNEVVTAMMVALRGSINSYVLAAVETLPDWQTTAQRLRRQHHAVLDAVRAGDGDRAARLVSRHIEGFHQLTTSD
jgi:GntR family transcriptional repressor for pyruvate dehydrogenase complex